jgi:hypothetical protein
MRAMIHAAANPVPTLMTGYPAVRPLLRRTKDSIYEAPKCNSISCRAPAMMKTHGKVFELQDITVSRADCIMGTGVAVRDQLYLRDQPVIRDLASISGCRPG